MVVCDGVPDQRAEMVEVKSIQPARERGLGCTELEDYETGARLEHAIYLLQRSIQIDDVPDPEDDDGTRRKLTHKRERQGIGRYRLYRRT